MLEDVSKYEMFIRALNVVINKYAVILTRHKGKKKVADEAAIDNEQ